MSATTKQQVEQAKKFFKQAGEQADAYQKVIPDKRLGEKLKKVSETSKEVVKHIEEHTDGNG
jgi:sulfur transfer protein SufE